MDGTNDIRFGGPKGNRVQLGSRASDSSDCDCLVCNDEIIFIENDFVVQTIRRSRLALRRLDEAFTSQDEDRIKKAIMYANAVADLVTPYHAWEIRADKRGTEKEPACQKAICEFAFFIDQLVQLLHTGDDLVRLAKEARDCIAIHDACFADAANSSEEIRAACINWEKEPCVALRRDMDALLESPAAACMCDTCAEELNDNSMTLGEFLQTVDDDSPTVEKNSKSFNWIADRFWPSPYVLTDLRDKLKALAKAIIAYEHKLVGLPIRQIVDGDGTEAEVFLDLLRTLGCVAAWGDGEHAISDGPKPLMIRWNGWVERVWEEIDFGSWSDFLPAAVWEIIDNVRRMGIPFPADYGNIGLEFDDVCFVEPHREREFGRREFSESKPTAIGRIDTGATFASLNDPNGKIYGRSIRDGVETPFEACCEIYADSIANQIDLVASRSMSNGRVWRIDLQQIERLASPTDPPPRGGYYPEELLANDPFLEALKLEGLTGATLGNDCDPIVFLMLHKAYRDAQASTGEQATFSVFVERVCPQILHKEPPTGLELPDNNSCVREDWHSINSALTETEFRVEAEDFAVLASREIEANVPKPPPSFDGSADWIMSGELGKLLNMTSIQINDIRKAAKHNDTDSHGRWGVDAIGTFRRNVHGRFAAYYIPEMSLLYKNRYAHAKSS